MLMVFFPPSLLFLSSPFSPLPTSSSSANLLLTSIILFLHPPSSISSHFSAPSFPVLTSVRPLVHRLHSSVRPPPFSVSVRRPFVNSIRPCPSFVVLFVHLRSSCPSFVTFARRLIRHLRSSSHSSPPLVVSYVTSARRLSVRHCPFVISIRDPPLATVGGHQCCAMAELVPSRNCQCGDLERRARQ